MVDIDPTALGIQMGGSALIGAVIGYTSKKVAKVIAVLVGAQLVLFKLLESRGVLIVNWSAITDAGSDLGSDGANRAKDLVTMFIETTGIGASFAGGFYLGFRRA